MMSKRFTSTEKFNDPWYRKLSPVQKCLWEYALCQCDFAGFWNVDIEAAAFHIGAKIGEKELEAFKGRFVYISSEIIFIPKFVAFQYGELNESNKAHQGVIKHLNQYGIEVEGGFIKIKEESRSYEGAIKEDARGYVAPKEKEKEKDKDKDKERKGVQGETKTYGEFLNVRLTDEEYEKLQTKYGNRLTEAIEKLSGYIASKGNKYKNHYAVLRESGWVWNEVMEMPPKGGGGTGGGFAGQPKRQVIDGIEIPDGVNPYEFFKNVIEPRRKAKALEEQQASRGGQAYEQAV